MKCVVIGWLVKAFVPVAHPADSILRGSPPFSFQLLDADVPGPLIGRPVLPRLGVPLPVAPPTLEGSPAYSRRCGGVVPHD